MNEIYQVEVINSFSPEGIKRVTELKNDSKVEVYDTVLNQLTDLLVSRSPKVKPSSAEMEELIRKHVYPQGVEYYGNWIYYPWSHRLVHLLPKDEFIELRTNRNLYRITPNEFITLQSKRIGIIGLSVGQSVAITMALERIFGEIYIADFDKIDLSNLNRIRTGIHNIGLQKTILVAREIAEIDPYIKVVCYHEGINNDNIEDFIVQNQLDLLIDECDSLQIKILSRKIAQKAKIPVLMDTSDRGMLDIERFDIQHDQPIFHGLLGDFENRSFENISETQRLEILAKIVGASQVSSRLKASVLEMQETICSWPQLASAVAFGGAIATDAARRILLKENVSSGRFYCDASELFVERESHVEDYQLLYSEKINKQQKANFENITSADDSSIYAPSPIEIESCIQSAHLAPSSGNNQPWLWQYHRSGVLYLGINKAVTKAFGDFAQIPTYVSLGAAFENFKIAINNFGYEVQIASTQIDNLENSSLRLVFRKHEFTTEQKNQNIKLLNAIPNRFTDRSLYKSETIPEKVLRELNNLVTQSEQTPSLQVLSTKTQLRKLGKIVAKCDKLRLLHKEGHKDFFTNELRWTIEDALLSGDGIDMPSLALNSSDMLGVRLLSDPKVANLLYDIDGGNRLLESSVSLLESSSHVLFLSLPKHSNQSFFHGGMLMQKIWLYLVSEGLSAQPVVSPLYFFYRYLHGKGEGLNEKQQQIVAGCRTEFKEIFETDNSQAEIIMLRIGYSDNKKHNSIRKSLNNVYRTL